MKSTNHLHHEDGSFQEYIALDADYLTILPDDIDPSVMGPVLCAGLTAYKAVLKSNIKAGDWLVVVGAGGGLGHLAGKSTIQSVQPDIAQFRATLDAAKI